MNKWFLLLIAIGLAVTGWYRRDMVAGWFGKTVTVDTSSSSSPESGEPSNGARSPAPTPNLALASLEQAKRTYPALTIPGSAFRRRFEADYAALKVNDPAFLARADWPILLGARTATELGGGAMPVVGGPPPSPHPPVPPFTGPGGTPSPLHGPQGLKGSALDQKPAAKSH
jgi:hypothetical protein